MTVARVGLAVVAVLVACWLAVMERNTRLEANSLQLVGQGHPVRAEKQLRDARLLNPDTAPDLRRALIYFTRQDAGPARAALDSVLRREPDNIEALTGMLALSSGHDQAETRRILEQLRRLDPLSAPRR
jgi:cytochrome c-type biogenesis protein CcmH/NrfG